MCGGVYVASAIDTAGEVCSLVGKRRKNLSLRSIADRDS